MKRFRRYSGSEFKRRDPSKTSISRSSAERQRQEQLQREFGIGWYEAYKMQRREAAEAREGGRDDGKA